VRGDMLRPRDIRRRLRGIDEVGRWRYQSHAHRVAITNICFADRVRAPGWAKAPPAMTMA